MNEEKLKALVEIFDGDMVLVDDLLARVEQSVSTWTDKEFVGRARKRIAVKTAGVRTKAAQPQRGTDFVGGLSALLDGLSDHLQRTGGIS